MRAAHGHKSPVHLDLTHGVRVHGSVYSVFACVLSLRLGLALYVAQADLEIVIWPRQAGLKLSKILASASQVLGL